MKRLLITAASLMIAATAAQAEIKIGSVLSVTGPASFLGDPEKKTLEMYVAEINAQGGVNGEQIKLFIYDDGGDANKARTFATRLVEEDKVDAVVGGSITGTALSMRDIYEDAENPIYRSCRRSRDRGSGASLRLQDAAYRADVLRQDFRRPEEAQPDKDRA